MSNVIFTPAQQEVHHKLSTDLVYAAPRVLKIKTKDGTISPLTFNKAQLFVHEKLEEQKRRTGMVRAMIPKARQHGVSTYIGARFFHHNLNNPGKSTFILTHEAATTDKLFRMVKRYHELLPPPMQPDLGASNKKELIFKAMHSEYSVGTAGNDTVGVGGTLQYFHGSEVALWPNGAEILAGILQSIARMAGTEIIFESTARGMGDQFYRMCMAALKGIGDYQLIFLPWFWDTGYAAEPPSGFEPTEEELSLMRIHNLTPQQMYWRRLKILELGEEWMFKREYPCDVMEAFQTTGKALIDPKKLWEARKTPAQAASPHSTVPKILGVDPAGEGGDRTILSLRQGRVFRWYRKYDKMRPMALADIVAKIIDREGIDACFIDYGHGIGTIDRLHQLGYQDCVFPVHFAEGAGEPEVYANKRAEIICSVKDWVHEGGVSVPDDDELHADFMSIPPAKEDGNHRKLIEKKELIKQKSGVSPDIMDSFALTFSAPVRARLGEQGSEGRRKKWTKKENCDTGRSLNKRSPLSTLNNARSARNRNGDETVTALNWTKKN